MEELVSKILDFIAARVTVVFCLRWSSEGLQFKRTMLGWDAYSWRPLRAMTQPVRCARRHTSPAKHRQARENRHNRQRGLRWRPIGLDGAACL